MTQEGQSASKKEDEAAKFMKEWQEREKRMQTTMEMQDDFRRHLGAGKIEDALWVLHYRIQRLEERFP